MSDFTNKCMEEIENKSIPDWAKRLARSAFLAGYLAGKGVFDDESEAKPESTKPDLAPSSTQPVKEDAK